jgi:hypothetical protein
MRFAMVFLCTVLAMFSNQWEQNAGLPKRNVWSQGSAMHLGNAKLLFQRAWALVVEVLM